jgi:hypothetical protein
MAVIKSNHHSPLGLPGGPLVNPGAKVKVERWHVIRDHPVIKAWIAAGVIEVVGEEQVEPKPEPSGPAVDRLAALRGEYQEVVGKRPYHAWGADELRVKITEAKAG